MPKKQLSVLDKHQIKIARQTLRMSKSDVHHHGRMSREEARHILFKFNLRK